MVGDKEHDVLGARAAGLDCVAVGYGYGTKEELTAAQPLKIVASIEELLRFSTEPLRRQSRIHEIWRILTLWDTFLISQIIGYAGLLFAMKIWGEDGDAAYYNHAILITGLTGIATMLPSLYFYQKDRRARIIGGMIKSGVMRHLKIGECVRILLMGAGFAQFANMLVNILGSFLNADAYQESMSR